MGCQSPVSLDSLQKDCKRPVHRAFVSLSVSITKFLGFQNKNRINIQGLAKLFVAHGTHVNVTAFF
jgi:hypothetical protein